MYSELSESKKEIDTLRNDLQYWKNETLNILKKYLLNKGSLQFRTLAQKIEFGLHFNTAGDDGSTLSDSDALRTIDEKLNIIQVQTAQSDSYNITDGT